MNYSKNTLDLTGLIKTPFPTADVERGICHSPWKPSTFYGDLHHKRPPRWPNNTHASRLWAHIESQTPITEWNVQLTVSNHPYCWARTDEADIWEKTEASINFGTLFNWISEQDIVNNIGRVVVFITQNANDNVHTDWVTGSSHVNGRTEPVDFLWYSSGGKRMEVEGQRLAQCCWFDNRLQHKSVSDKVWSWSIRADGKFSNRVRKLM